MQHRAIHSSYVHGSVTCYSDGYILDASGEILYLSIFGGPMELKTITAQIMQGWQVNVYEDCTDWRYVTRIARGRKFVKPWSANMANVGHKVFFSLTDFTPWKNEFSGSCALVFGRDLEQAKNRLFLIVRAMSTVPLSPQWSDWLWSVCEDVEFQKFGEQEEFKVCRYVFVPDNLDEKLLDDLRSGRLTLNQKKY